MDGRSEQFNKKIAFSLPAKRHFPFSVTATRKNGTELRQRITEIKKIIIRKQVIYSDFTDFRTNKMSILALFIFFILIHLK